MGVLGVSISHSDYERRRKRKNQVSDAPSASAFVANLGTRAAAVVVISPYLPYQASKVVGCKDLCNDWRWTKLGEQTKKRGA
jgi:hypothetical protein